MPGRYRRHLALAVLLTCFVFVPIPSLAGDRSIIVRVYNRTNMAPDIVLAGEGVAKDLLAEAGVESVWVNCPLRAAEAHPDGCSEPVSATRLVLAIVKHWKAPVEEPSKLGLAVQDADGRGAYCYVFEEELATLAQRSHIHSARLLGYAAAHELGHLLKGTNSHSSQGLMSARWYEQEVFAVRLKALNFTRSDAVQMRIRLLQR